MAFQWENDLGEPDLRFTEMSNSLATIAFRSSYLYDVQIKNVSSRAITDIPSYLIPDNGSVFNTPPGNFEFQLKQAYPDGAEVDLIATIDTVRESMLLTPTVRTNGTAVASSAVSRFRLSVPIIAIGNSADCVVCLPGVDMEVYAWDDIPLLDAGHFEATHPGHLTRAGGVGAQDYDEPTALQQAPIASFLQFVYVYNFVTEVGLMIRSTDKIGTAKKISVWKDLNGDINVEFDCYGIDNSIGNNGNSDYTFHYGIEFRPMIGDCWDALSYYRDITETDGFPIVAKGTIKNRSNFPVRMLKALVNITIVGMDRDSTWVEFDGQTLPHTLGTPTWENVYKAIRRIKGFFGGEGQNYLVHLYGFWPGVIGQKFPVVSPLRDDSEFWLKKVANEEGVTLIFYSIPQALSVDDLPGGLGINSDLAKTRTGYSGGSNANQEVLTPGLTAAQSGLTYLHPNFLVVANNQEAFEFIRDQIQDTMGSDLDHGRYWDAWGALGGIGNDDASLQPEDRGVGATTFAPALRAAADLFRTVLGGDAKIIFGEHTNDMFVGSLDLAIHDTLIAGNIGDATARRSQIFSPSFLYSRFLRLTSHQGLGVPPNGTLSIASPGYATEAEVYASIDSYYFHAGQMAIFYHNFDVREKFYTYLNSELGDEPWFETTRERYEILRTLYFKRPELILNYHMSKMLVPLSSSQMRGLAIEYIVKGNNPYTADYKLFSSVWHDEGSTVSPRDTIAIFLNNWSFDNPETVVVDDVMLKTKYPALGDEVRDVWVTNIKTGLTELRAQFDGGTEFDLADLNLSVGPTEFYLIEMVPAGENSFWQHQGPGGPGKSMLFINIEDEDFEDGKKSKK